MEAQTKQSFEYFSLFLLTKYTPFTYSFQNTVMSHEGVCLCQRTSICFVGGKVVMEGFSV